MTDVDTKGVVIVVDDNEVNRKLLEQALPKQGFKVQTLESGVDAVKSIPESVNGDKMRTIVLMDLEMEIMDGFEATKILKQIDPGLKIIAYSSKLKDGCGDKEVFTKRCKEIGFNGILGKPLKPAELGEILDSYIETSTPLEFSYRKFLGNILKLIQIYVETAQSAADLAKETRRAVVGAIPSPYTAVKDLLVAQKEKEVPVIENTKLSVAI